MDQTIEKKKAPFFLGVFFGVGFNSTNICISAGGKKQCDPNAGRFVRYQFTPAFLQLRQVGAT